MHDFTDDIDSSSVNPSDSVPQNDQRIEFDDFDTFRNASTDAFRYY